MAGKYDFRDIAPVLRKVRDFLLGRQHTKSLRFSPEVATRSPPLAVLPDGPSHRLFNNYYYSRDARREVMPPEPIQSSQKQLASGAKAEAVAFPKPPKPGNTYAWD